MTPRQFHNRLNGWKQGREFERNDAWHQTRSIIAWQIKAIPWRDGYEPDIMRLMPLPGDPPLAPQVLEISDEDMAFKKYKAKRAHGFKFNDEFEALIRKHYQPDWGPHPDELTKPKP